MDTYTPSITPRLRVARNSSHDVNNYRSQIASASEGGPSRLPELSQLVDVNFNDMGTSETSEQTRAASTIPAQSIATRSGNPAAVLRALLSRLPASPERAQSPSQQYLSERESDYDMDLTEAANPNAVPSTAQESLKDIFSKARGESSSSSKRDITRRSSFDTSDIDSSMQVEGDRTDIKGKQRSLSEDEMVNFNESISRPPTRSRPKAQPVTKEFLRERFSESRAEHASFEHHSSPSIHNSSNDTATILRDLDTLNATSPEATSTPMHSLRMSFNSQFQSNLLDQDTEMQHAIDDLDSYGENSGHLFESPPPAARRRSMSRAESHSPVSLSIIDHSSKTPTANLYRSSSQQTRKSIHTPSPHGDNDDSFSLNHALGTDWNKTPRSRRISEENPSGFAGEDENEPISEPLQSTSIQYTPESQVLNSNREDTSRSVGSHRSQERLSVYSNNSRHSHIPHISANGHRSVSLSRASSPSASSAGSQNNLMDHDILSEEEPRHIASGSSPRTPVPRPMTPQLSSPSQPSTVHRLRNNSQKSVDRSNAQDSSNTRRLTAPIESPGSKRDARHVESSRSQSPMPAEHNNIGPSRTSSLQVIDNTYHIDPSVRHPSRSSSPLSFSKKQASSPNVSSTSRSSKSSNSSSRKHAAQSLPPEASSQSTQRSSTFRSKPTPQSISSSPPWPSVDDERTPSRRRVNGRNTEELRDTDFSSQSETPRMRTIPPPNMTDDDQYQPHPNTPMPQPSNRSFPIPVKPHILVDDHTPPLNSFEDVSLTPPRMSTPKNAMTEPKSLSSSIILPDLPTPSSSDESEPRSRKDFVTPRSNYHRQEPSWMPTPKPPGGWLQTPMVPTSAAAQSNRHLRDDSTMNEPEGEAEEAALDPKTPIRRLSTVDVPSMAKTPRLPGAWRTPAAASASIQTWNSAPPPDQNQGLLTPVNSLSKASTLDPKTPYVPGGWAATPAARKSILKVRFNPKEEASRNGDPSPSRLSHADLHNNGDRRDESAPSSTVVRSSPTRTPRRSIRVLDAFGREESGVSEPANANLSKSVLRVVDAMGHEVQDAQKSAEESKDEEELPPMSRGELLSRIRRGLDNLVEDIDDIDSDNKGRPDDYARIEELNAVSRQARHNRARLQDKSAKSLVKVDLQSQGSNKVSGMFGSKYLPSRFSLRFYMILLLVQVFFVLLMYRLSVIRAKELFLNAYYDPFNPDLHIHIFKYENSFRHLNSNVSGTSWRYFSEKLLHGQENWLHFLFYLRSYFTGLWNSTAVRQNTSWSPS